MLLKKEMWRRFTETGKIGYFLMYKAVEEYEARVGDGAGDTFTGLSGE